jgi:hypothetical protein
MAGEFFFSVTTAPMSRRSGSSEYDLEGALRMIAGGFQMLRIAEFEPIVSAGGVVYRPRVYADHNTALWDGYLVFFPLSMGTVVSTPRETTQSDFTSLQTWASGLDRVYLEGALARALETGVGVAMPTAASDLAVAEIAAATDAIALHRAAERVAADAASELTAAERYEAAATVARENASQLTRREQELEKLANESARTSAEAAAEAHESAAREARAVAADVGGAKRATAKSGRKRPSRRKR